MKADSPPAVWTQVLAGALLMLATLPGRTHGLGLITEPLLEDLNLSRYQYAQINTWATLLGALVCLPVGAWLDRFGLRLGAVILLPALAGTVALMSGIPHSAADPASLVWMLFGLVLLTRIFGQSALSVLSLAVAGRVFKQGSGAAAGVYSLLVSVFFAVAFVLVGGVVRDDGWRQAWLAVAIGLVIMMPVALLLRSGRVDTPLPADSGADTDLTLGECLRLPSFWAYSAGIAAFAAISSGVGLFNEALLAERGFDQKTYHSFQGVTFMIALLGQILCGVGMRWMHIRFWLAGSLVVQALVLVAYRYIGTSAHLWTLAGLSGLSAGVLMVAFYGIWGDSFGKRHLGRIQGVAQMCSVVASALGPLLLERGSVLFHGYAPALASAAPACLAVAVLVAVLKPRRTPVS